MKENDQAVPKGFAEIPFNILVDRTTAIGKAYSERRACNDISVTDVQNTTINGGVDSILSSGTYVLGDFDHDGKVTETDTMYVLKIVVGTYKGIKFHYNGKEGDDYAKILTYLAADTNKDGDLTVADAIWMNKNRD